MIHFDKVTKVFKTDIITQPFVALKELEFSIPQGSMVGFLGANGAGKTTSLKIIMDFIRPTSGQVSFSEILGKSRMEIFKNIGFLPERPYFYPNLKGEEFLTFMGKLAEVSDSKIKSQIKRWAPRFKIEHALSRELKTYSKGMLQRIGFLATILHEPKLIILDEPLSGLDPIGRKELKDVIIEVHREGKTVFFSSHIVPDVEEMCDRVIFLREGNLVYDGLVHPLISSVKNTNFNIVLNADKFNSSAPIKTKENLPNNLVRFCVDISDKDHFLKDAVNQHASIISVEVVRPSLEEIFYNTKGKNETV